MINLRTDHRSALHGNAEHARSYGQNTVFLSARHANNHNAECFIHNGLDWTEYGQPHLGKPQNYFHFLAVAILRLEISTEK